MCLLIDVRNVCKAFGDKAILVNASMTLDGGKVKVLMGANGSGKTTLINIISGFILPDDGEIMFRGKSLINVPPYIISRLGISRTFQDMRLIKNLSVIDNVLLSFPEQRGEKWYRVMLPDKAVKKEQSSNVLKAIGILSDCFIDELADSKAGEISYGQQKLLNLACCIANDSHVLLLDEPVAGLSFVYREKIIEVIKKLQMKKKAILIIEHNVDFIERVADKILFLSEGLVSVYENYHSFKMDEKVQNAYI